ncbi:hypothetical protein C8Q76DRAFT_800017 [Earliella scabrosa]|nr:hypothetical protein C8Q76DRAFT_800017 [Earliella scabrosa]
MIRLTDFPDDILEDIFHAMRNLICFPGEKSYYDHLQDRSCQDPERKTVPLWANVIALSHVCRHWRGLMLTRPHLWTFIRVTGSFTNRLMVNEMIERSGAFPLSILFTVKDVNDTFDNPYGFDVLGMASLISDYSERIQELGVVLPPMQISMVMESLSSSPVPIMEKLWLDDGYPGNQGYPHGIPPISLFDSMIPPLRTLHAHRAPICWLPFQNLEKLELTCGPAPPLSALLDTLRDSPLLKFLTLRIPTPKDNDGVSEDEPRVLLPYLRQLQLGTGPVYDASLAVLPHIMFPHTTSFHLSFTERFESSVYDGCDSLEEIAAAVGHVSFVLSRFYDVYISCDSPPLSIRYKMADKEDVYGANDHLARLCEGFVAFPLPALTSLSLAAEKMLEPEFCPSRERFSRLFKLTPTIVKLTVDLYAEHVGPIFGALGTPTSDAGGGASNQEVLCPELKELTIRWFDTPDVDDCWRIERCCNARASLGARLERLETSLEFPQIVLDSLKHSVRSIATTSSRGVGLADDLT